ncbi:MAG: type VI secretion system tube protein Hcp [Candidatus Korobacteraceae bacterium]
MAVADYFLKLDGIPGESQDSKHKGEIQLESWSHSATNRGTAGSGTGGMGAGKVDLGDLVFTKTVDKSGPKLFQACCSGEPIKSAVLVARKAGKEQQEYLKITLGDSLVSSYSLGASGGSDVMPTEQFSLNFSTIKIEYKEQKPDGSLGGSVPASWSRVNNTKNV